jgi:arabinogalactan oligomer/maltooligosaccharide transport system substrate-binding protein
MEQAWGYGGDMLLKVVDGDADPAATVRETAALLNEANGK